MANKPADWSCAHDFCLLHPLVLYTDAHRACSFCKMMRPDRLVCLELDMGDRGAGTFGF